MRYLFLLFIILPVLEITLLIKVGGLIGLAPTVALILASAFLGAYLLRRQGLHTLFRINQRIAAGEVPAKELLEGVAIAVGGALLLTPGFITDAMGFFCIMPGTRHLLVGALLRRALIVPMGRPIDPFTTSASQERPRDRLNPHAQPPARHSETIEGEFRREDP